MEIRVKNIDQYASLQKTTREEGGREERERERTGELAIALFSFISIDLSLLADPCVDNGHPCYNADINCTKLTDTTFKCGDCPRGMRGDGVHCNFVNEVSKK